VDRPPRRFNPLRIPKKLQAALPYASKPKVMKPQQRPTYMQKRAVVMEPEEKKAIAILQQIRALRKDQVVRRKEKQGVRREEHKKKIQKIDEKKLDKKKDEKKEHFRKLGMKSKMESQAEEGGSRKRRRT
jgi:ribosome biogenesis protein BMS1